MCCGVSLALKNLSVCYLCWPSLRNVKGLVPYSQAGNDRP